MCKKIKLRLTLSVCNKLQSVGRFSGRLTKQAGWPSGGKSNSTVAAHHQRVLSRNDLWHWPSTNFFIPLPVCPSYLLDVDADWLGERKQVWIATRFQLSDYQVTLGNSFFQLPSILAGLKQLLSVKTYSARLAELVRFDRDARWWWCNPIGWKKENASFSFVLAQHFQSITNSISTGKSPGFFQSFLTLC